MSEPATQEILTDGVDHVGLSVASLGQSLAFFTQCLNWHVVGERPDYPAAFVSDGQTRVTLWQVAADAPFVPFDRRRNVGLHHLALKVRSLDELHRLHRRVVAHAGVTAEFAPEMSGVGPRVHFMVREPGGCRLEFVFDPRSAG